MEINFMKTIGLHENVVTMLGCCTLYPPLCLVVEYVPNGDLLHYLRDLRKAVMTRHSSHPSLILPALNAEYFEVESRASLELSLLNLAEEMTASFSF